MALDSMTMVRPERATGADCADATSKKQTFRTGREGVRKKLWRGSKAFVKAFLDQTWINFAEYTVERLPAPTLFQMAWERARSTSLDYIDANMRQAMIFRTREPLWETAMQAVRTEGQVAEFGVFEGYSIRRFAARFDHVYGFDSFQGLRENWIGHELPKGAFDLKGVLPAVPGNVQLIPGWFDQTVPAFLEEHPEKFKFVHIDSDTYEAAAVVLPLIGSRLQSGTVLVFDEYLGFPGWRQGEYRAWQEHVERYGLKYQYLAYSEQSVALRIL